VSVSLPVIRVAIVPRLRLWTQALPEIPRKILILIRASSFCFRASHSAIFDGSFEPGEALPSHIITGLIDSIFTGFVGSHCLVCVRAQDLCEAEAATALAGDAGRSWKAKEEVDLFFRFQGSFCHLERIRVHLCPEKFSVISVPRANEESGW